jgi:hypothetical protein
MRIQTDTLKYAKILKGSGFSDDAADGLMSTLTQIEIYNIYRVKEVDNMLSEAVKQVFVEQDKKLAEQQREFDARMVDIARRNDKELGELKHELKDGRSRSDTIWQNVMNELASNRRWTIATIITVGLSIATYLSALIHFNH